ncbi:MAG TPA: metallopeptidase TldD-related protein [Spirochaetales bacterium]|nr:metallopeptidase TldD-related protein [Spirochaetales bacterium]HPG86227.1 metallopeptidase TldD-related protein [Spirochaetales bacterium]
MTKDFKKRFDAVAARALGELLPDERGAISYSAELSAFMRFNGGKVRQSGSVEQADLSIKLWKGAKTYSFMLALSGDEGEDDERVAEAVGRARALMPLLPDDPYQAAPEAAGSSDARYSGTLLPEAEIPARVLGPAAGLDFTGIYSQGLVCRGAANSAGARHWFQTETFLVDYSAWLPNGRAVKSSYAGLEWSDAEYAKRIAATKRSLENLGVEQIALEPGKYRAFITADALAEVVTFFSWNGFGERGLRQGESAYIALREGRESMSPRFGFSQDFSLGVEPAFNDDGELAPERLEIVSGGAIANTVVCSRTAKQYGVPANGAGEDESVRSISMDAGDLAEADALKAIGTGVYVSNFHYLNWSDVQAARVTGMTRFACLWVENGEIVGPIKDMRWDESLYNMLGAKLEAVTKERHLLVASETYERRQVGGSLLPGILVDGLSFTL